MEDGNAAAPPMETYRAEFEVSQGKGGGGDFQADSVFAALAVCIHVAGQSFPHVQGWSLVHKPSGRVVARVPLMAALKFFAPAINQASRTLAVAALPVVSPERFEGDTKLARERKAE